MLGLRPLFIMRMAPKSYIHMISQFGGYAMILRYQLYPYGADALRAEVRQTLKLPVDIPRQYTGR